jgi:hypothetical protein
VKKSLELSKKGAAMLIRFRFTNFLSFKEQIEFSLIPGRMQQHPSHILSAGESRYDMDVLRAAVLYGANASGKSNLVKAISFARNFILKGSQPKESLPVKPFKLDRACLEQPSRFEFEFRHQERNYLYGFALTAQSVQEEWLYELKKTTETLIFERKTGPDGNALLEFGKIKAAKKEKDLLHFVAQGTRPNQLFLRESIERNLKHFEAVYQWFAEVLVIVFPESRHLFRLLEQAGETQAIVDYLQAFDTGVCGYDVLPVQPKAEFPPEIVEELTKKLEPGGSLVVINQNNGQRYQFSKNQQQELIAMKLMLRHRMAGGEETVLMDSNEESDGTVRLLDLAPILAIPPDKPRVFIVDELDRSLHPAICYQLLQQFLAQPAKSQLIVTTHESNLLDFDLLRRDEIWFVEKDQGGASRVYSLEEFTPRYDKDIQKGYLLGRFGAIPVINRGMLVHIGAMA